MIRIRGILGFILILSIVLISMLVGSTLYRSKIIGLVDKMVDVQERMVVQQNEQDTTIKNLQDRMNIIFFNHGKRLGYLEDRMNTVEDRITIVEQVSKGALDLGMKDKDTVGWNYLLKGK